MENDKEYHSTESAYAVWFHNVDKNFQEIFHRIDVLEQKVNQIKAQYDKNSNQKNI